MKIQIHQFEFPLSEPFSEGHICSAGEAKALNLLRGDRIRNYAAKYHTAQVKKANGAPLLPEVIAELYSRVANYDISFVFRTVEGPREKIGTMAREVEEVATEKARERLRAVGREGEEEALGQLVELLSTEPSVLAEAASRFEARQRVSAAALEELFD